MREFEQEYKNIKPSQINVDPLYQRELETGRVKRIVKEWNDNLVNPPKVSFRDGKYWVFDGQHTISSWRKVYGDKAIRCRVYYGMTWLDECEMFIAQNGVSKDPTTNDKLKAAFNTGDPDVIDMVKAARYAGVTVNFKNSKATGKCVATASLFKAYKNLERSDFIAMLEAIMAAWPLDRMGLTAGIINGLSTFYKTYKGQFKQTEMVKTLTKITPNMIIREGREMPGASGRVNARVILRYYNKHRTVYRLEDII